MILRSIFQRTKFPIFSLLNREGLARSASEFKSKLDRAKKQAESEHFTFYGYETIKVLPILDQLLAQANADFALNLKNARVADIGAGDGDLGFCLEYLGAKVDLFDLPSTNWNQMLGLRALHKQLGSEARIFEMDLDRQFEIPDRYDVVFLLGILYHLKNPYYVLETLHSATDKLILSTRVARFTEQGGYPIQQSSVAYLLGAEECNNDATNFWIFSETGLKQLLSRTGWSVEAQLNFGDTKESNPQDSCHDERIFLLLKRR